MKVPAVLPAILLALAPLAAAADPASPDGCGGETPCSLGARAYRAAPPPGWDGAAPLPVLIHFHGWGRTGAQVLRNRRIADAAAENGLLLIAPDGLGKSWSFWGSDSRDVDFTLEVIADAARRWPADRARVFVSGFSYGAAMAWRLACASGPDFAAYIPIAGTLWRQESIDCPGGPARIVAVHGLRDTVMDLPTGPGGETGFAVSLWRRVNASLEPAHASAEGIYDCRSWPAPPPGREVTLCLHDGGHSIPKDWLARVLPGLVTGGPVFGGIPEDARVE